MEALNVIYCYLQRKETIFAHHNIYRNSLDLLSGVPKVPSYRRYHLISFQTYYSYSLQKFTYITMQVTIHCVDRSQTLHH